MSVTDRGTMAVGIINQIIAMQTPDDQKSVLSDLAQRYGLYESNGEPEIFTDQQVSEKYGVHIYTVQEWLRSGQLKGFKEARKWYTRSDWLRDFENEKANGGIRKTSSRQRGTSA